MERKWDGRGRIVILDHCEFQFIRKQKPGVIIFLKDPCPTNIYKWFWFTIQRIFFPRNIEKHKNSLIL